MSDLNESSDRKILEQEMQEVYEYLLIMETPSMKKQGSVFNI